MEVEKNNKTTSLLTVKAMVFFVKKIVNKSKVNKIYCNNDYKNPKKLPTMPQGKRILDASVYRHFEKFGYCPNIIFIKNMNIVERTFLINFDYFKN